MAVKKDQRSIYCDNCGEPCAEKFIAGQCQTCGGYICKQCFPYHLCMLRKRAEIKRMQPNYIDYDAPNVNAAA